MRMKIAKSMYEKDEEKKKALRKELVDESIPEWFGRIDSMIEKNGQPGVCVGKHLTIVDVVLCPIMHWLTSGVLDGVPVTCLDAYKHANSVKDNVEGNEKVKAFR